MPCHRDSWCCGPGCGGARFSLQAGHAHGATAAGFHVAVVDLDVFLALDSPAPNWRALAASTVA